MDPDALAQTYWHLHVQDRAAWTQEIDLRPSSPRFLQCFHKGYPSYMGISITISQ